jgi:hypothetical protein
MPERCTNPECQEHWPALPQAWVDAMVYPDPQWFCTDCQQMTPQGHTHNPWEIGGTDE